MHCSAVSATKQTTSQKSIEMDLNCKYEERFWNGKSFYSCRVTAAEVSESKTKIRSLHGEHQNEKSDGNVEGVKFINLAVKFIPMGLIDIFRNLTVLQIWKIL
jgi:hypothetical protein